MPRWNGFSSESYRILADATYDWESWMTVDGLVRWVNPAVYRFSGYSVAECLDMQDYPLPLVHPDDRLQLQELLAAGMAGAQANDVEFRILQRTGQLLDVAGSWQPVAIPGAPRGLRLSIRDISERKRAERALRVSESLYRSILDSAWEGVWLLDPEGRTEFVNMRMAELLGESPAELIGRDFCSFLTDDSPDIAQNRLSGMSQSPRHEITVRRRDGQLLQLLLSSSPRQAADGGYAGFLLMALAVVPAADADKRPAADTAASRITPSVAAEQASAVACQADSGSSSGPLPDTVQRNQRLVDLSRLAAQVAHEINNPLASVRNALRLLRDQAMPDASRREFHGLIDLEIERISRVVRRMLDLQHSRRLQPAEFDLVQEIAALVKLLHPTASVRQVQIHFEEKPPHTVCLPYDELRQILFNLLTNAIEASPPGACVTVALQPGRDAAVIQIRDEGPGIRPEHQALLFEPFFTTKAQHGSGGQGLGLAVCRNLADSMGLQLDFTTAPNRGTEFRITIPAHNARKG